MPENLTLNLQVLLPEFVVIGAALAAIITELLLPAGRRALPMRPGRYVSRVSVRVF